MTGFGEGGFGEGPFGWTEVLEEGFELDGVLFGDTTEVIKVVSFTPASVQWRRTTATMEQGNGQRFGRDYRDPGVWAFGLHIDENTYENAMATLASLQEVWESEEIAETPNAMHVLRYRIAGRTRRVYGRGGRFAPILDVRRISGSIPITADFERVDHLHYDDGEQRVELNLVPATTGGLKAPLKDPLRSMASPGVQREGLINVAGTSATWAVVEFTGATGASDLSVTIDSEWTVGMKGPIANGETITIDGHPWARTVITSLGGGSASSRLVASSRLERMRLTPGPHEIHVNGVDPTGTATIAVAWRNASKAL